MEHAHSATAGAMRFEVDLFHAVYAKRPVRVRQWATPIRVGFEVEKRVVLPFPPFVGLVVEIPPVGEMHVDAMLTISDVLWSVREGRFRCTCTSEDAQLEADEDKLLNAATDWESAGFTVNRRNICQGQWVRPAKSHGEDGPGEPT